MPTQPQPQDISEALLREMNAMAMKQSVDSWKVRKIKHDAKALQANNVLAYHMVLARCACLMGDLPEMRKEFEILGRMSLQDPHIDDQYAISLFMWGFYKESHTRMLMARSHAPGDISILKRMIKHARFGCRFREVSSLYEELAKLGEKVPQADVELVSSMVRLFDNEQISDDIALQVIDSFGTFCRDEKVFSPHLQLSVDDGDSELQSHVTFTTYLVKSEKDVSALSWKLFDYFAELQLKPEMTGRIMFSLISLREEELMATA